jgi:hypothetical protein
MFLQFQPVSETYSVLFTARVPELRNKDDLIVISLCN